MRRARWEGARHGAFKVEGVSGGARDGALEVDDAVEPRRRLEDSLEDDLVEASVATARIVNDAKTVPDAKDKAKDGPEAAECEAAEVTEGVEDEEQDPQLWARVQDLPGVAHGATKNHQALLRARQHLMSSRPQAGEIYSAEIDCSEPVELDLRAARKRIAKCEELIAHIKASELPVLVLEELNHLEMVLREAAPTTARIRSLLVPGVPL